MRTLFSLIAVSGLLLAIPLFSDQPVVVNPDVKTSEVKTTDVKTSTSTQVNPSREHGVFFKDVKGDFPTTFRERLRGDRDFANYVDQVDVVQCGDNTVLFGVVNSEKAKADLAAKVRSMEGVHNVQNRVIVK